MLLLFKLFEGLKRKAFAICCGEKESGGNYGNRSAGKQFFGPNILGAYFYVRELTFVAANVTIGSGLCLSC